jgi:hypothetical protein
MNFYGKLSREDDEDDLFGKNLSDEIEDLDGARGEPRDEDVDDELSLVVEDDEIELSESEVYGLHGKEDADILDISVDED